MHNQNLIYSAKQLFLNKKKIQMKSFTCFLACLFIVSALSQGYRGIFQQMDTADFLAAASFGTDQDTIQQIFNGFWEEASLADPTTPVACFDDASASLTVTFAGNVLDQLANNDVSGAKTTIETYVNQLPQPVKDCLGADAQVQQMLQTYHIAGIPATQVEEDITKFFIEHILQLHKDAVTANNNFKGGNYAAVGNEGGVIAKQIFGNGVAASFGTDQDTIQQIFNGFWEEASLADPTTPVACFDDASASLTVTFAGNVLDQLANNDVSGAKTTIETYVNALPQPVKDCLGADAQVQQVLQAYKIAGIPSSQVEADIVKFFIEHILQLHKDAVTADNNFHGGNYAAVGNEGGVLAKQIFGSGAAASFGTDQDTIQQIFNGFWEEASLADPTTPVACFDDASASLTVTFAGNVLDQLANNDVSGAKTTIETYVNALPQPVKDCLGADAQVQQVLQAYKIAGIPSSQVEADIVKFFIEHILQLHKDAVTADNNFHGGNYAAVGNEGGVLAKQIFGGGETHKNLQRIVKNLIHQITSTNLLDSVDIDEDSLQVLVERFSEQGFDLSGDVVLNDQSAISVGTDQDTIQQIFNGFWEEASLADPTTPVACFDDASASLTVTFAGNVLDQLANNDVSGAKTTIETYVNALPQPVKDCLGADAQVQQVLQAYKIAGIPSSQVEADIVKFFIEHILQLHKDAVTADNNFHGGNYAAVGNEGGVLAKQIFGGGETHKNLQRIVKNLIHQITSTNLLDSVDIDEDSLQVLVERFSEQGFDLSGDVVLNDQSAISVGTDQDTIQQIFNGFWEEASLADPTTPVACFDDASASLTVTFAGNVLDQLANNDVSGAKTTIETYVNALPQPVKDCLGADAQVQQVLQAYKIAGIPSSQVEADIVKFFIEHILQLHKDAVTADNNFHGGNYAAVGNEGGVLAKQIFG